MTSSAFEGAAACEGVQPLTARLEPWMRDLLASNALPDLVKRFGSPVNLQSTAPFKRNLLNLKNVAKTRGLKFKPFFARKANKCLGYVKAARDLGFGVDTASFAEVDQSLRLGVPAADIVCTAAVKSERLLRLCVDHEVTLIIDNDDELNLLANVARSASRQALIGVRVSGFRHGQERLHSRFGFNIESLPDLLVHVRNTFADAMEVTGLHCHLNGYDADHRLSALQQLLPFAEALNNDCDRAFFIDIGGGIPMRYLDDKGQWDAWLLAHGKALQGQCAAITKHNHGLGRTVLGGRVVGQIDAYPTAHDLVQERWLAHILDQVSGAGTVASALSARNIELRCEPGRSALDGCGMTVAEVQFRKRDTEGNWVIGAAMNRTQCRTGFAEFMVDPILVHSNPDRRRDAAIEGFVAGTYCTESEWLSLRKLRFAAGVDVGDLLVFPNTAGYLMHFLESRSHQFDLGKNLFISDQQALDGVDLDDIEF